MSQATKAARARNAWAREERRKKALNLRKAGFTYPQIAQILGLKDEGAAFRVVRTSLREIAKEASKDIVELETQRLDAMLSGIYDAATSGDLRAIDRAIRISERRSALLGLDAPKKTEATLGAGDAPLPIVQVMLSDGRTETVESEKASEPGEVGEDD